MKGKAYSATKSKIARNLKVIDRVNRDQGYFNPYSPSPKRKGAKKRMSQAGDASFRVDNEGIPVPSYRSKAASSVKISPNPKAADKDYLQTF